MVFFFFFFLVWFGLGWMEDLYFYFVSLNLCLSTTGELYSWFSCGILIYLLQMSLFTRTYLIISFYSIHMSLDTLRS
ncbi:hypothetical protein CROQUDRAFT_224919 [Cronartium quercuum f. sp. fusiforme G11]|uniref:Uncharacterized protein n=1 Tax=Cronartium quercuum f. sp. fusiforme G11 TaxID=708437 RepID=A0A9P6NBK2_9BASI|nr:hypothetical protein CROQUDRAFT_224919 [Cronartium quercuum f. sp. fusiforme G11]